MENQSAKIDYEQEREMLFGEAIKKCDPEIQKTIDLIEKINGFNDGVNMEITISCIGTTN